MEGAKRASSFRSWSAAQGITTNGIDYCEIPNSGLGIVAKRRLEVIYRSSEVIAIDTII